MNINFTGLKLTPLMIETLMEIHEREIMGQDLCGQEVKSIAGLYRRGVITTKKCTNSSGKTYIGFFVTEQGKQLLNALSSN